MSGTTSSQPKSRKMLLSVVHNKVMLCPPALISCRTCLSCFDSFDSLQLSWWNRANKLLSTSISPCFRIIFFLDLPGCHPQVNYKYNQRRSLLPFPLWLYESAEEEKSILHLKIVAEGLLRSLTADREINLSGATTANRFEWRIFPSRVSSMPVSRPIARLPGLSVHVLEEELLVHSKLSYIRWGKPRSKQRLQAWW